MKKFTKIKKIITALIVSVAVFFSGQVFLPANFSHVKAAEVNNLIKSIEKLPGDYYANDFLYQPSYSGYYYNSEIYKNLSPYQYSVNNNSNDAKQNPLSNDVFGWGSGANILNDNYSLDTLIYRFDCLDPRFLAMPYDSGVSYHTNNYGRYTFTLYKCNKDGETSEKIIELYIEVNPHINAFIIAIKRYKFGSEMLGISEFGRNVFNGYINGNYGNYDIYKNIYDICLKDTYCDCDKCKAELAMEAIESYDGTMNEDNCYFDVVYYEQYSEMDYYKGQTTNINLPFYGEDYKFFYLIVSGLNSDDKYSDYYIDFTCDDGVSNISVDYASPISSSIASIYSVSEDMYEREHFNSDFCDVDENVQKQIIDIVKNGKLREVQVSYLVQIGNTPFAKKVSTFVKVPVTFNTIKPSDVAQALGLESLSVGQSPCSYFVLDSSGVYNAYYLKNVWISSKDANGNSLNYFLDINKSYKEFYDPFVVDGIFTKGMYEWLWSSIINAYPVVADIPDGQLYGYFGYCVVPYTYSLNQLVYELFDGIANMNGILYHFSYRQNLTYDNYTKLLNEYQYGWLEKSWYSVAGFVSGSEYPADHYFFYCDGKQDNAYFAHNGASDITDNHGALYNSVEGVIEGGWFGKILALIFLILLVVIFSPFLLPVITFIFKILWFIIKTIFKFIWSILTFPFRLLKPK